MPSTSSSFLNFLCSLERPILEACSTLGFTDSHANSPHSKKPLLKTWNILEPENKKKTTMTTSSSPRVPVGMIVRQESFKRSNSIREPAEASHAPCVSLDGTLDEKAKQIKLSAIVSTTKMEDGKRKQEQTTSRKRTQGELLLNTNEEQQRVIARRVASFVATFSGDVEPEKALTNERIPSITLDKYVDRLIKQFNKWAEEPDGPTSIGVGCAVLAVEYLKRCNLKLSAHSVHRCYLGAFLVAIKLLYDYYMSNNYWASVGGVSSREVNSIEAAFCKHLNWKFGVSPADHETEMQFFMTDSFACVIAG